jgi:transcriptional regulator with XRE-family HTH domain
MASKLGGHFQKERRARGLSLEQLARLLGARNTRKAASRIGRFECQGVIKEDLLALLAEVLGVEPTTTVAGLNRTQATGV